MSWELIPKHGEKTSITRKQSVLTACENEQLCCLANSVYYFRQFK